eukprot:221102-Amphidinium_carterae.5
MRQSSGFEAWRQLTLHYAGGHRAQQVSLLCASMQPKWDPTTKQFTRQYHKWLEDINRYESENGQGSVTDHVKIAAIINHLKGPIAQHLMLRWISNFFNSTYTGTDDDNAAIGAVTEETDKHNGHMLIAFNDWYESKGKGHWHKGKGKDKGGKKGDNHYNHATTVQAKKRKVTSGLLRLWTTRSNITTLLSKTQGKGKGNKGQSYHYNIRGQQNYQTQEPGSGKSKGKHYNNYNGYNTRGKKGGQQQVFDILDN